MLFPSSSRDLKDIVGREQQQAGNNVPEDERLFLRATACEIYLDQVYDLLGGPDCDKKRPCKIRVDGDGQLVVHGEVTSEQLNGISEDCRNGNHATLVTLAPGLCSVAVREPDDLEELARTCAAQRACGTSTVNRTSSRSHAILRLEVVSYAVNRAKDELQLRKAEVPALQNARDNCASFREKRQLGERIR